MGSVGRDCDVRRGSGDGRGTGIPELNKSYASRRIVSLQGKPAHCLDGGRHGQDDSGRPTPRLFSSSPKVVCRLAKPDESEPPAGRDRCGLCQILGERVPDVHRAQVAHPGNSGSLRTLAPLPLWHLNGVQDAVHGVQEFYETLERITNELRGMTEHSSAFLSRVRKAEAPNYYDSQCLPGLLADNAHCSAKSSRSLWTWVPS
jgi:hypothetical protein